MAVKARHEAAATAATPLVRADAAGIATLTLNRPEARNPLSEAMLDALTAELDAIAADKRVRAVIIAANGPVVFHNDYTPVTTSSPARAGETLIVYAKGLGPTSPDVTPGDKFPSEPLAIATSPVEVLVNGRSSPAINQIGLPGTTDTYRVDFRVPDDTVAGTANVQISAAWVKGAAVSIPVR